MQQSRQMSGQQQETSIIDATWFAHQDGMHLELARQGLSQCARTLAG